MYLHRSMEASSPLPPGGTATASSSSSAAAGGGSLSSQQQSLGNATNILDHKAIQEKISERDKKIQQLQKKY